MEDQSESFAGYLEDLIGSAGYWEGESLVVPKNLIVATLSLLQHLVEETQPTPLARPLVGPVIALNNALGECQGLSDR